ncbi:MAG: DUF2659 family protein [Rickettsiaceae bacterium]|nr:DUF2659 family protein [Rickettsiaceae bacterium]
MSDILDEVLNDAKDEKRYLFFKKTFPIIVIISIIATIAIGLYNWNKHKTLTHNKEVGSILISLLTNNYQDQKLITQSLEKLVTTSNNRQAELADLRLVSYKIVSNDLDGAMSSLETIIANNIYHEITTAYGRILWLNVALTKKDLSDTEKIKARNYMQYFSDEKQVFYYTATLLKAFFYQQTEEIDLAKENLHKITHSNQVPGIIRQQAIALQSLL